MRLALCSRIKEKAFVMKFFASLKLQQTQELPRPPHTLSVMSVSQVDVPDFLCILGIAKPREGEVFVDLGSGTGKAVLTAACGFPEFSKVHPVLGYPTKAVNRSTLPKPHAH